ATVGMRRLVDYLFAIGRELRDRYPLLEQRSNRYLPVLQATLRWIVCIIAVLAVLEVWGVDAFEWLSAPAGRGIVGHLVTIAIVLVVALVVWELVSSYIERRLARPDAAASARLRTLLPLARRSLLVVLVVMVSLVILSEIGVDIGPLLAGAGIVGLAIGFGSQALVKDVITGFFILMEDSVAVGDIAEVAG